MSRLQLVPGSDSEVEGQDQNRDQSQDQDGQKVKQKRAEPMKSQRSWKKISYVENLKREF